MTKGLFIRIFGAGGRELDPGGQAMMGPKALARGLTCRAEPYDYTDTPTIIADIRAFVKANPGLPVFLEGDSCGGNVLALLIAALKALGITVDFACAIQPSIYCNFNYPNIQDNCRRFMVIFSDWAHTAGLGVFIPQLEVMPTDPNLADNGWHLGNKGRTKYFQKYVPAPHPDDQDIANVQNPIFAVVDAILAEYAGAA